MNCIKNSIFRTMLLLIITVAASPAYAEVDKIEISRGYKFAPGYL